MTHSLPINYHLSNQTSCPIHSYAGLIVCMNVSTHTVLLERVESKDFHLINSSPITDCLQPYLRNVASLAIFYHYFHANYSILLTAFLPSCGLTAQGFLLPLTPILSNSNARVNQYSQSRMPLSGKFWNSLPASVFPISYELTLLKRKFSGHLSLSFA